MTTVSLGFLYQSYNNIMNVCPIAEMIHNKTIFSKIFVQHYSSQVPVNQEDLQQTLKKRKAILQ